MGYAGLLLVLLVAPATLNVVTAQPPGSAGHHGSVQAGAAAPPLLRLTENSEGPVVVTGAEAQPPEEGNNLKAVDNLQHDKNKEPAREQHLSINQDGQYSFGYSAANSARQERRHPDGSVVGSYSYTDPTGKVVEVAYTADANGFNAVGENLPPRQVLYAPYPVQDTPEVAAARAQFLEYYQREFNHRKSLEARENASKIAAEAAEAVPSSAEVLLPSPEAPIPVVALPETAETVVSDASEGDSDSEIVTAYDASSGQSDTNSGPEVEVEAPKNNVPLYNVQFQVGNPGYKTPGQYIPVNSVAPQSQVTSVSGPGYFYYVGVGGLPYYVSSPARTNIAVSVRASQLGAIPAAAVHDGQTPHYGQNILRTRPSPPVYVEVGQDYADVGKSPAVANSLVAQTVPGNNQKNNKNPAAVIPSVYPVYFPFYGVPINPYQQ